MTSIIINKPDAKVFSTKSVSDEETTDTYTPIFPREKPYSVSRIFSYSSESTRRKFSFMPNFCANALGRASDFRQLSCRNIAEDNILTRKKVCSVCKQKINKPCFGRCSFIKCEQCSQMRCKYYCDTCLFTKKRCGNCEIFDRGCDLCFNSGTYQECIRCKACIIVDSNEKLEIIKSMDSENIEMDNSKLTGLRKKQKRPLLTRICCCLLKKKTKKRNSKNSARND